MNRGRARGQPVAFEEAYPNITDWVRRWGWIEIGSDGLSSSLVRALDEGGMVWEGETEYASLDEALRALEKGLAEWIKRQELRS